MYHLWYSSLKNKNVINIVTDVALRLEIIPTYRPKDALVFGLLTLQDGP